MLRGRRRDAGRRVWDVFLIVHIVGFCALLLTRSTWAAGAVRDVAVWVPLLLMEPGVLVVGRLLSGWHGATVAGLLAGGVVILLLDAAAWWGVLAAVNASRDRRRR